MNGFFHNITCRLFLQVGVAEEVHYHIIDGLVQDGSNSSALAMGLLQFGIKPSMQDCSKYSALAMELLQSCTMPSMYLKRYFLFDTEETTFIYSIQWYLWLPLKWLAFNINVYILSVASKLR